MTPPHYDDGRVQLWHGDCLDVLRRLPDASIDAVVTDPPYGLGFMGKEWDTPGRAARATTTAIGRPDKGQFGSAEYGGASYGRGFLDATRAFGAWCEQWAADCLRVLRPGGHLLAFGGTRTYHRLACAIEDAGFEARDSIGLLGWVYGQGFPKSLNLPGGLGTALKPAWEPIVVARKPLAGTVAANVLAHGAGALNIDACRVGADSTRRTQAGTTKAWEGGAFSGSRVNGSDSGRWPSNVVLSHAPLLDLDTGDVIGDACADGCVPSCHVAEMNAQSGTLTSGSRKAGSYGLMGYMGAEAADMPAVQGDSGGASRFFPVFRYEAKADSSERPRVGDVAHPTVKPLDLMRWLVRLVTPPGGTVLEPFAGSGTTAEACVMEGFRCVAVEREADYLPLIVHRLTRRTDPVAHLTAQAGRGEDVDLGLFDLLTPDPPEAPS